MDEIADLTQVAGMTQCADGVAGARTQRRVLFEAGAQRVVVVGLHFEAPRLELAVFDNGGPGRAMHFHARGVAVLNRRAAFNHAKSPVLELEQRASEVLDLDSRMADEGRTALDAFYRAHEPKQ